MLAPQQRFPFWPLSQFARKTTRAARLPGLWPPRVFAPELSTPGERFFEALRGKPGETTLGCSARAAQRSMIMLEQGARKLEQLLRRASLRCSEMVGGVR